MTSSSQMQSQDAIAELARIWKRYEGDPDGAIRTDLGSLGLPVTVFFDADGNQVAKVDGELSQSALDEHLNEITP